MLHFVSFFNNPATTEIYTLSLHDALPIFVGEDLVEAPVVDRDLEVAVGRDVAVTRKVLANSPCRDRKSTRLNSSHQIISYAVFCLKKKTNLSVHPGQALIGLAYGRAD